MIDILTFSTFALLVVCVFQYRQLKVRRGIVEETKQRNEDIQQQALELSERFADISSLSAKEAMEAIMEQGTTLNAESDIWKMPLPYGRWESFPDEKGRPEPEIKGFWLNYPGRLIGVKMPKGSEYDMHSHPWVEILIGGSGIVWVEVESQAGSIETLRLSSEDVIIIPSGARHAVLTAESEAHFVCIWGLPKKDSHD